MLHGWTIQKLESRDKKKKTAGCAAVNLANSLNKNYGRLDVYNFPWDCEKFFFTVIM